MKARIVAAQELSGLALSIAVVMIILVLLKASCSEIVGNVFTAPPLSRKRMTPYAYRGAQNI